MALSSKVVTFNVTTGTSNIAVTGVGFQPKAIIIIGCKQTATGQGAHVQMSMGWATSATSRGCIKFRSRDAQTTTDATHKIFNDLCWAIFSDSATTDLGSLDFVSMDADGFTVVPDVAFGTSWNVTALCLGGDSLTDAAVLNVNLTSGTGNQSFTGAGFQPDCVLALSTAATAYNSNTGGAYIALGSATSSTNRACITSVAQSGAAGSNTRSILRDDRLLTWLDLASDSVTDIVDFVSFDADGLTINKTAHPSGGLTAISFLVLKGASVKVGTVAANTSTGTGTPITGVGFKPAALLMASTNAAMATQGTTPNIGFEYTVGVASAAAERGSIWGNEDDALSPSDNQQRYDTGALWIDYAGSTGFAVQGVADLSTFDSDGFTLNTTDGFPAANLAIYLALGPGTSSYTPPVLPFTKILFRAA